MQPATICSARDATCNAQRRGPIAALRCAAPQVRREADAREVRARLEDGADLVQDDDGPSCRGLQVARASLRLPASTPPPPLQSPPQRPLEPPPPLQPCGYGPSQTRQEPRKRKRAQTNKQTNKQTQNRIGRSDSAPVAVQLAEAGRAGVVLQARHRHSQERAEHSQAREAAQPRHVRPIYLML